MSLTFKHEAKYGDTLCYLDGEEFAYWPSHNGSLFGEPKLTGGVFTTMKAKELRYKKFQELLPQIRVGMRNAFINK